MLCTLLWKHGAQVPPSKAYSEIAILWGVLGVLLPKSQEEKEVQRIL